jgi:predicted NUDIX family phosphoesterase
LVGGCSLMSARPVDDEELIVVPVDALRAVGLVQGYDPDPDRLLAVAFSPGMARPLRRSVAESDEHYKQLICYVVLLYGNTVFHYRRSARVGESRLAGLRSFGIGGHLNVSDGFGPDSRDGLLRAIRRELAEEVFLDDEPPIELVGAINDDSNPVGRVHLGLVALARCATPNARLRDETLTDGRFQSVTEIERQSRDFETWSLFCLPAIRQESSSAAPR